MLRALRFALLPAVAALAGCSGFTNSGSFNAMSIAYRDVVEQYSNDNILLNVVRAAKQMPLSFLDIPSIMGSGTLSTGASLNTSISSLAPNTVSGFFSAATGSSASPGLTMSVANGFNFTQSSLDNSNFMASFLTDMKPDMLANLGNSQESSKAVLYTLAIESIEAQTATGQTVIKLENNPYDPNYDKFQKTLYTLIRAGLKAELNMQMIPASPPMDNAEVSKNMLAIVQAQAQPGTMLVPAPLPNGRQGYQLVKMPPPEMRLCLTERNSEEAALTFRLSSAAYCKSSLEMAGGGPSPSAGSTATASKDTRPERLLLIKLRSPRDVFQFLGGVVNMQMGPTPNVLKIVDERAVSANATAADLKEQAMPLFVVNKGRVAGESLMTVSYQGDVYSIPKDSQSFTNQVIVLLSQMLTLSKVPGSIPASPAVLIR